MVKEEYFSKEEIVKRKKEIADLKSKGLELVDVDLYSVSKKRHLLTLVVSYLLMFLAGIIYGAIIVVSWALSMRGSL